MATKASNLTAPVLLALAKLFNDKEIAAVRESVQPGSYSIEQAVLIQGRLSVAPPLFVNNPGKVCPWALLQLALNRLRPESVEAFVEEAIALQKAGQLPDTEKLKATTNAAIERLLESTRTERRGVVQFEGGISRAARGKAKRDLEREPVDLFAGAKKKLG